MKKNRIILFYLLIILNITVFCEDYLNILDNEIEFRNNLELSIRKFFEENDRDKICLDIPDLKSYQIITGYIPEIRVRAENIFIDDLRTDLIYMELYNIRLDLDKLMNEKSFEPGPDMKVRFHAEISEENINDLLERKKKKIKVTNPKAVLKNGHIYLYGNVKAAFISSNIKAKGNFYLEDEKKINFYAEYISLERVKMPKFLLVKIVNTINPVIDLERNRFDIRLNRISIKDKLFVISSFKEHDIEKIKNEK